VTASGVTGRLAGVAPTPESFVDLAARHAVVPVAVEVVADTLTPVAAFAGLVGDAPGFLLESAEGDERWGRYSFVGANVLGTYWRDAAGRATATGALPAPRADEGALAYLDRVLGAFRTPPLAGLPPLHAGLVGVLAYDVVREVERIPAPRHDDLGHPDAAFHLIGELLAFDHWRQRVTALVNVAVAGLDRSAGGGARARIVAGDVFQVVISQRFDTTLTASPLAVYRALRALNPSPYLYLVRFDGLTVLGSSPEALVRLRDGVATMRPIAGSRPRGRTALEDERLAGELVEDPKERAEHVMLVDLGRNDLGRVCRYGTIEVEQLMVVERFSHVTHLTSQVAGRLRDGVTPVDVLRATLPAGTLTGAPKVRAMELINELEPTRRGVYGGVVGYLDLQGNLDTAIAIRTLVVDGAGRASVQAGAGIVVDSDPEREDAECHAKAAALLAAIGLARSMEG